MIIFLIVGLLLGAAVVVFAMQNITPVTVMFLTWKLEGSIAFILILAVLVGALISVLILIPSLIKRNFQISRLKNQHNVLKEELVNKKIEVESEKSKLAANNAYLDDLEKTPKL